MNLLVSSIEKSFHTDKRKARFRLLYLLLTTFIDIADSASIICAYTPNQKNYKSTKKIPKTRKNAK